MGAGKGTAPRPLGGRGPLYLSDSLTALLLTLGGFFAFLSACGAVWPAWMPAAVGAMALAAVLVWSLPRGAYLAAGGILALGALAVWRRWELLVPTLEALWSVMAEDLGSLVILTQTVESTGGAALWYGSADAQQWLAGLYPLAMGWAAVRQRWWYVALALALLPSAPAIAAGTMPDWLALMAALAGGLALLLSDLFAPEDPAALGRGQMVSLGTTVLLLAALNLALPQEGYVRPQWADTAHNRVVGLAGVGGGGFYWGLPACSGPPPPGPPPRPTTGWWRPDSVRRRLYWAWSCRRAAAPARGAAVPKLLSWTTAARRT